MSNYNFKVMPKHKFGPLFWTLEILYSDGSVDSTCSKSSSIREQFEFYVNLFINKHSSCLREIRMLDNCGRVYKCYKQCY